MKRREFLKNFGVISTAGTVSLTLGGIPIKAFAKPFLNINNKTDKILVLIQLKGGNDGINTVIPLDQYSLYANNRPSIKIEESQIIKLNNATGLHPALQQFLILFNEGKLNLVQNVGYQNPNRSHFRATDIWLTASDSNQFLYDGWAARYLLKQFPSFPDLPPAHPMGIQISSVPSALFDSDKGSLALNFSDPNSFYTLVNGMKVDNDPPPSNIAGDELKFLKEVATLSIQYANIIKEKADKGNPTSIYPSTRLGPQLKIVADLILGGLETPVYLTQLDGFDTHSNQLTTHQTLLQNLADSILAFQRDMEKGGFADKVIIMTFSEFGRRVKENASLGTDHGAALPVFIIGNKVNGGIIGANSNLSNLDSNGDIKFLFDYRQIYATILKDHFIMPSNEIKGILFNDFSVLPIIKASTEISDFSLPDDFMLYQNFPNPFNPITTIKFSLSSPTFATLKVYDILGNEVTTLLNEFKNAGNFSITFDASNLSSGTYFYTLKTKEFTNTKKMILIK
ncbi:MAG: DUF1501 domain-containing protein [Melioribacteraceae bacterium]|nr:DUF1501 domain-containing protein [Melioribacteraceae bacterium]